MTSPLFPTFRKRINDSIAEIVRKQVTPWSFLTSGVPLRVNRFNGDKIAYQGITFEGSPRQVFWGRYIEPFLEDLCVSEIAVAVAMAHERGVDASILLPELQGLLSAGFRKVYVLMADVDRRLRGRGFPGRVALRPIDQDFRAINQFLEERIRAESQMLKAAAPEAVESNPRVGSPPAGVASLIDFIQAKLRSAIFAVPDKEVQIQNAIENLIIGRSMVKGTDYDRETGRVKTSGKESIPDFIFPDWNLCLEVKLSKSADKLRAIVDEINADIRAYATRYHRQLYIVYDLGVIRDEAEFKRDLEGTPGISVLVVKH